jgi:hypothetical protein
MSHDAPISAAPPSRASVPSLLGPLLGGFSAGVLDIVYACVSQAIKGRTAEWTLQTVASGVLGLEAFDGGAATASLGLALHFVNALGAAFVFFLVSRSWAFPRERPVVSGLIYGPLVYLFMNFVVIPLSAFPYVIPYPPMAFVKGFVSHALLVGLPISLAIRWADRRRAPARAAR